MQSVVTDEVAWSVCQFITILSAAKTAEPIEMPFGMWDQMGPMNHVLDGVQIPPCEGQF